MISPRAPLGKGGAGQGALGSVAVKGVDSGRLGLGRAFVPAQGDARPLPPTVSTLPRLQHL